MLQKLNERLTGLAAWIIIGLIALTLTLLSVDYYRQSHRAPTTQIEVNGIPITKQRFELNLHRAHQRANEPMNSKNENLLLETVQEGMIVNEVSLQAAKRNGFDVTDAQANDAIYNIPQFQEKGRFSAQRYEQLLNNALFTPHTFQEEVRQGMLLNQQRFAFIGTAFVLPNENNYFVNLLMQSRDYDFVSIPTSAFAGGVHISDEQLKSYYANHRKDFIAPEQVSLEYLELSLKDLSKKAQITDAEAQRYYDENTDNFLDPAQWQVENLFFAFPPDATDAQKSQVKQEAQQVFERLEKNPAEFDLLLKSFSEGKTPGHQGGTLPWIVAGKSRFDKTLAKLDTPGQIAGPAKSLQGYLIFKLLNFKPANVKAFNEVKSTIKEQLKTELAQVQYAQAVEKLNDLSYQYPDSLEPTAEALGLKLKHSDLISRLGGGPNDKLGKNEQVLKAAFSRDVLELKNNSEPIQLDEGSVIVIRVAEHIAAKEKTWDEIKPAITAKLALEEARKEAQALGKAIIMNQKSKPIQEQMMQKQQLHWETIKAATREGNAKIPVPINNFAFSLTKLNQCEGQYLNEGKDYLVLCLRQITPGDFKSLDKEQQESLIKQVESNEGQMNYELYLKHLLTTAKIVKH